MDDLPPEALLASAPPPMREIGEWLRGVVLRAVPDAIERVRPGWGLIGYDVPIGRRTRYFAFVWAEPVHVHLGFEHGALMSDPNGWLEGRGITKRVRWVTLTPESTLDEATLVELLLEARRVATLSRDERTALAMSIEESTDGPGSGPLRRWDPREHR